MVDGRWSMVDGRWSMAADDRWPMADGRRGRRGWRLEVGGWRLEVGALEVGRCDELAGLFLGGLVSLLLEAGWEWLIEPDHLRQRPKTPHAIDLHGARSGAGFRGDPGDAPPRVVAHEPQQGDDAGASPRSPARRLH